MATCRAREISQDGVLVLTPLSERRGGCEARLLNLLQHEEGRKAASMDWTVVFLEDGPMVQEVRFLGVDACVIRSARLSHWKNVLLARREDLGLAGCVIMVGHH